MRFVGWVRRGGARPTCVAVAVLFVAALLTWVMLRRLDRALSEAWKYPLTS